MVQCQTQIPRVAVGVICWWGARTVVSSWHIKIKIFLYSQVCLTHDLGYEIWAACTVHVIRECFWCQSLDAHCFPNPLLKAQVKLCLGSWFCNLYFNGLIKECDWILQVCRLILCLPHLLDLCSPKLNIWFRYAKSWPSSWTWKVAMVQYFVGLFSGTYGLDVCDCES